MSYPQPSSNSAVADGNTFFRLRTPLVSDGDIYESEQSARGLAIGPEADISKVIVAYPDLTSQGNLSTVSITPDSPFPAQIQALNDQSQYTPANRPARILIWPEQLFNANWRPASFDSGNARFDLVSPVIDVVEYFAPVPYVGRRTNKAYRAQFLPWGDFGVRGYFLALPFYGRRYASIHFTNSTDQSIALLVAGVTFRYAGNAGVIADEDQVIASTPVASNASYDKQVLASTMGMYDYLLFSFTPAAPPNAGASPLRVVVSDQEQS